MCKIIRREFKKVLRFCPNRHGKGGNGSGGELLLVHNQFVDDGRGTFYLFDALFRLVQNLEDVTFSDEAKYVPPARNDLLGLPNRPFIAAFLKAAGVIDASFAPDPVYPVLRSLAATECWTGTSWRRDMATGLPVDDTWSGESGNFAICNGC